MPIDIRREFRGNIPTDPAPKGTGVKGIFQGREIETAALGVERKGMLVSGLQVAAARPPDGCLAGATTQAVDSPRIERDYNRYARTFYAT
jgi:hypothetical protein